MQIELISAFFFFFLAEMHLIKLMLGGKGARVRFPDIIGLF